MRRFTVVLLALTTLITLTACTDPDNNSSESQSVATQVATPPQTEKATEFLDTLNSEEKKMYRALIKLSNSMLEPDSIRLVQWTDGKSSVTNESKSICVISGKNKLGGTASDYYEYASGNLWESHSFATYTATKSYDVDKVNKAIRIYFKEQGY